MKRVRWSAHVQRTEGEYTGQRMMKMDLPSSRKTSDNIHGCSEERHAEGRHERERCWDSRKRGTDANIMFKKFMFLFPS